MKRSVNGVAVIIAGITLSALGCASSGTGLWNPVSQFVPSKYSDDTRFKIARIQEQENKLGKARALYEELYRDDSKNAEICHRLAIVSARMSDDQQADRYFREAIALAPDKSDLLADYGYALFRRNDLKGAEQWLQKAINVEPTNKRAANNLAIVLGHQGRAEESLAAFRRVVGEAEAQANLAYIHVQRGEGRMAVERYNKALAIDKNLHKASHALLQLAKLEQRYLQTERAKRLVAEAKARKAAKPLESLETGDVQLAGATRTQEKPSGIIRKANYELVQTEAKPAAKSVKAATAAKTAIDTDNEIKPAWLTESPAKKPTEPVKTVGSAAEPFPQTSSPKPVAPTVPKPSVIQQVSHTTEPALPATNADNETFKLTPKPPAKDDPAFATPAADVKRNVTVTPIPKPVITETTPKPEPAKTVAVSAPVAKTDHTEIPVIDDPPADKSAKKGFVPTRPGQAKLDRAIPPSENPFADLDRRADEAITRPQAPARVQLSRERPPESPARISIAPKAARIRLAPDSE